LEDADFRASGSVAPERRIEGHSQYRATTWRRWILARLRHEIPRIPDIRDDPKWKRDARGTGLVALMDFNAIVADIALIEESLILVDECLTGILKVPAWIGGADGIGEDEVTRKIARKAGVERYGLRIAQLPAA